MRYCAALANEGGGKIILGVSDRRPRKIVGTKAFNPLARTQFGFLQRLHQRVDAQEIQHPDGRVLVFTAAPRLPGHPIRCDNSYWMRSGESLVAMTPEILRNIFAETGPDFSAERCLAATHADLDPVAIERLRAMWIRKSGNADLAGLSAAQLLEDAELTIDGKLTYAALILLGTQRGLGRHLAQAEVIFEYRSQDVSIPWQKRENLRMAALLALDDVWSLINDRLEPHQ